VQRVDAGHEVVGAAEHPETAVDRIAHQRADREHGVEARRRGGRKRRKFEAVALRRVEEEAAIGARERDRAQPAAGRRTGMHQQFGDLDCVVERVGANDADLPRDRVEGLDAAGERAGMGHGGAAPGFRLAELDRDDRLAGRARHAARRFERREPRDRLDIDDDDLQFRLVGEEGDVIGDREPDLVAAGDQVLRRDAALLQRLVGEDHHAAALADERHRASLHVQRTVLGQGYEPARRADIAHAVRSGDCEPGLRDHVGELTSERGAVAIEAFAETGRKDRGAARARGGATLERFDDASRGHQHHQMIGRLRKRAEIAVAGLTPDLGSTRIDEVDRAGKLVAVEVVPHPRGPAARPVAGADQNDITRRGERRHLRLGCVEIHLGHLNWVT
jgi:hypothetical protein